MIIDNLIDPVSHKEIIVTKSCSVIKICYFFTPKATTILNKPKCVLSF